MMVEAIDAIRDSSLVKSPDGKDSCQRVTHKMRLRKIP